MYIIPSDVVIGFDHEYIRFILKISCTVTNTRNSKCNIFYQQVIVPVTGHNEGPGG